MVSRGQGLEADLLYIAYPFLQFEIFTTCQVYLCKNKHIKNREGRQMTLKYKLLRREEKLDRRPESLRFK